VDAAPGGAVDELPRWRALAGFLLTDKDTPRKTVTVNNGFPAGKEFKAQKEAMLAALAGLDADAVAALVRLRRLPPPRHDDDAIVRALARLMTLAAAELWLVFREAGEVDFGELAARAIGALGDELDPTELGLRLDWRIRHLLVDEFQDTSPTQVELLQRLTAGWQQGDGRTLFCVGDPMQSIYRFRQAEVGLFLRAQAQGIGGLRLHALRLSRNNRALPPVVAWINAGFPQLFPARDEPLRGEIAYRPFVATRDDCPMPASPCMRCAPNAARARPPHASRPSAWWRSSRPNGGPIRRGASPCWCARAATSRRWSRRSAATRPAGATRRWRSSRCSAARRCRT
jgi:ATP-dependent helicase/nuclease subunit A